MNTKAQKRRRFIQAPRENYRRVYMKSRNTLKGSERSNFICEDKGGEALKRFGAKRQKPMWRASESATYCLATKSTREKFSQILQRSYSRLCDVAVTTASSTQFLLKITCNFEPNPPI